MYQGHQGAFNSKAARPATTHTNPARSVARAAVESRNSATPPKPVVVHRTTTTTRQEEPKEYPFFEPILFVPEWQMERAEPSQNYALLQGSKDTASLEKLLRDPTMPILFLGKPVYEAIMEMAVYSAEEKHSEAAAYLLARPLDSMCPHWEAFGFFMTGQTAGAAEVEMEGSDLPRYYDWLRENHPDMDLANVKMPHVHVHPNMGVFWSSTDKKQQYDKSQLALLRGDRLFLVVNEKREIKGKYVNYAPVQFEKDDITVGLSFNNPQYLAADLKDIRQRVRDMVDGLVEAKRTRGYGYGHGNTGWDWRRNQAGFGYDHGDGHSFYGLYGHDQASYHERNQAKIAKTLAEDEPASLPHWSETQDPQDQTEFDAAYEATMMLESAMLGETDLVEFIWGEDPEVFNDALTTISGYFTECFEEQIKKRKIAANANAQAVSKLEMNVAYENLTSGLGLYLVYDRNKDLYERMFQVMFTLYASGAYFDAQEAIAVSSGDNDADTGLVSFEEFVENMVRSLLDLAALTVACSELGDEETSDFIEDANAQGLIEHDFVLAEIDAMKELVFIKKKDYHPFEKGDIKQLLQTLDAL